MEPDTAPDDAPAGAPEDAPVGPPEEGRARVSGDVPTGVTEAPAARRPRWVRALVAGLVVFELAAGGALVVRDAADERVPAPTARPTATRPSRTDRAAAVRTSAVDTLLDRRALAIRTHDRVGFEATLDASRPAFVARQRRMFAALADVPIGTWDYVVDADDVAAPPAGYGTETWAPKVTLRYQLEPFDEAPAEADQFFTFVRRGTEWLVADDTDGEAVGRRTGRDIWDVGPVDVVRGKRSLVLGHPSDKHLLHDVARHADGAVPRVSDVWGTAWPRAVVVLVPRTQADVATILADGGDLTRVAAVAIAALPGGASRPVGNRIVVNPPNFRRLGPTGRRVVVTHEVTHVATRDATGDAVPTWLVEGFADYVGYLNVNLSARTICQELAAEVRAGRVPEDLPRDDEFEGGNVRLAQTYEAAWLAVRLIAHRVGENDLVTLYRRAATEPLNAVIRDMLSRGPAEFVALWRDYVKNVLT